MDLFDTLDAVQLHVHDGLGRYVLASAEQIIEAARKAVDEKMVRGMQVDGPRCVGEYLVSKLGGLEHEVFAVMFLDSKHRLIGYQELFAGTLASAMVYPREILKASLHHNAAALVLVHCHPSGSLEPSEADKRLTAQIVQLMAQVEVSVLDHVIVGGNQWISMADRGMV